MYNQILKALQNINMEQCQKEYADTIELNTEAWKILKAIQTEDKQAQEQIQKVINILLCTDRTDLNLMV